MKLATEAKTNPKAVWKYMNSKTKNREGVSDLNTDPKDPKSRLTDSDREKADALEFFFFKCFYYRARWRYPSYPTSDVKAHHGRIDY